MHGIDELVAANILVIANKREYFQEVVVEEFFQNSTLSKAYDIINYTCYIFMVYVCMLWFRVQNTNKLQQFPISYIG